jgi:acyl phosphate:glycerol-3-phosphate acyltransferase
MADAADLKSAGAIHVGSSPSPGTQESNMPWLVVLLGYFLGALPTAFIAGHTVRNKDIRQIGDKNAGAANAYRELGPVAGVVVGIVDAVKGALVILIAQTWHMSEPVVLFTGLAAVIGHNWPVFLGFRGGRGVSTTLGILFVLVTVPMLILTLPTLLILVWKKNVTPSMAFLFIALPLLDLYLGIPKVRILYGIGLPALIGITTFFRTGSRALRHA